MKTPIYKLLYAVVAVALLAACGAHPSVPKNASRADIKPFILPDYTDVTVPCNIAPLNFMSADTTVTSVVALIVMPDGKQQTFGQDNKVQIPEGEWRAMCEAAAGKSLSVTLYCQSRGEWTEYAPFEINIAQDRIDDYISYRLIEPGYVIYNEMSIAQRELGTFQETEIFNNQVTGNNRTGQCINCHSYQNYSTQNMLFHVRVMHGGTVIVVDGKPRKVDLKRPYTISAGVYPSWHPTQRLVAFSTDKTHQLFHTADNNKVEVFDDESDLILYDIDRDSVLMIANDPVKLEVFPTWAPQGDYLYYCSAIPVEADSTKNYRLDFRDLKYNLYRRSFDYASLTFGEEELVYAADSLGRSISLPRTSPDGRFITFAEGEYGYFNIWHREADIKILDIEATMSGDEPAFVNTTAMNSAYYAESYPSFSSNGKWVMCASRRDDGNFSRVYIAYFDGERAYKAFELPQRDPMHNTMRLKSYNRPEFMKEPVGVSFGEFADVVAK